MEFQIRMSNRNFVTSTYGKKHFTTVTAQEFSKSRNSPLRGSDALINFEALKKTAKNGKPNCHIKRNNANALPMPCCVQQASVTTDQVQGMSNAKGPWKTKAAFHNYMWTQQKQRALSHNNGDSEVVDVKNALCGGIDIDRHTLDELNQWECQCKLYWTCDADWQLQVDISTACQACSLWHTTPTK